MDEAFELWKVKVDCKALLTNLKVFEVTCSVKGRIAYNFQHFG
jgi:hypothetical protein